MDTKYSKWNHQFTVIKFVRHKELASHARHRKATADRSAAIAGIIEDWKGNKFFLWSMLKTRADAIVYSLALTLCRRAAGVLKVADLFCYQFNMCTYLYSSQRNLNISWKYLPTSDESGNMVKIGGWTSSQRIFGRLSAYSIDKSKHFSFFSFHEKQYNPMLSFYYIFIVFQFPVRRRRRKKNRMSIERCCEIERAHVRGFVATRTRK